MAIQQAVPSVSRFLNVIFTQIRTYKGKKAPIEWKPDGVRYGLVTYYPRRRDHQDPPITPTKLFMIQRIKPYKFNPYWHKKILDHLGLNDKIGDIAIVKNTPEMCASLWKVKHLIKVTPINTPLRIPDSGTASTYLHENGDLLVVPKINEARLKATHEFIQNPKRMDRPYINDVLRRKWNMGLDVA